MILNLNRLLTSQDPQTISSSWVLKHAPHCYRFICKYVRTVWGAVDWDRVTRALNPRFQRKWMPRRIKHSSAPYRNPAEVQLVLEKYREQLYVFLAPQNAADRHFRDVISIALVRMAQHGNRSAKQELMKLVGFTVDDWMEGYRFLSRWRGHEAEVRANLERCIRRYRYTGSFLTYVYRTLTCAARGIRPIQAYSLDEPISDGSIKRSDKIWHQNSWRS
jgi:hypothetical protein